MNSVTVSVPQDKLGFSDYLAGQTMYMQLAPVDECENDEQKRGWYAALFEDGHYVPFQYDDLGGAPEPDEDPQGFTPWDDEPGYNEVGMW